MFFSLANSEGGINVKFVITIFQDEDGIYIAECPAIPGCVSQGQTEAEGEKTSMRPLKNACK
jgi:hypothetical protein